MNPVATPPVGQSDDVRELARKLAEPFFPEDVKFLPIGKPFSNNTKQGVVAFVDARTVTERLNDVCGLNGWQDKYKTLTQGEVRCVLSIRIAGEWIKRSDVGAMSKQEDMGDQCKAAHSDALKRAAVKFGVGLYLYRIKNMVGEYDGHKITRWPTLPTWAIHPDAMPAGKKMADQFLALVNVASQKAKTNATQVTARLLTKYDYKENTAVADVEKRFVRLMIQEVNEWIAFLSATPQKQIA